MQFSAALKLSQTCCLPVLTEFLLEWRGPVVYMVQSEGDLQTIQCHKMFSAFTVSFLGAFTIPLGDFCYCWALCWYFHGTPSHPVSGTHSWRAAVSSGPIISKVKLGLFSFRHSILHLSILIFIFTLQHNQSHEATLRPALPCESAENLSACRRQCLTGLLSLR